MASSEDNISGEYHYHYSENPPTVFIRHRSEPNWRELTLPSPNADLRTSPEGEVFIFEGPYTWQLLEDCYRIVDVDWLTFSSAPHPAFQGWIDVRRDGVTEEERTQRAGPDMKGKSVMRPSARSEAATDPEQLRPNFRAQIEKWTLQRESQPPEGLMQERKTSERNGVHAMRPREGNGAPMGNGRSHADHLAKTQRVVPELTNGSHENWSLHQGSQHGVEASTPNGTHLEDALPVNLYLVLDARSPAPDRWSFALARGRRPSPPSANDNAIDGVSAMCGIFLDFEEENMLKRKWFKVAYVLAPRFGEYEQQTLGAIKQSVSLHLVPSRGVDWMSDQWWDEWLLEVVDALIQNMLVDEKWAEIVKDLVKTYRAERVT